MIVHLVDGTYELYRQHYGQAVRSSTPAPNAATIGVLNSTMQLLTEGATYIGVASDHVIESFRNDLWAGYKTSEGMEPEILGQIPIMVVLGTVLLIVVNLPFDLLLSLLLYVVGTATMFGVSALYHRVPWKPKAKALMQRFDHSAIFLAIAGGYTPVAVLCLDGWTRWGFCSMVYTRPTRFAF